MILSLSSLYRKAVSNEKSRLHELLACRVPDPIKGMGLPRQAETRPASARATKPSGYVRGECIGTLECFTSSNHCGG